MKIQRTDENSQKAQPPFANTGTVLPSLLYPWLRLQTMAILALPLILWPCKKKLILPAWLGYALYPAHLIVLWVLEQLPL